MQNTVFENVQPAVLRLVYLTYNDKVVCTGIILTLYQIWLDENRK